MKRSLNTLHVGRKPLCAAILGGIVAVTAPTIVTAVSGANPWAASKTFTQGQTLLLAACNPCNPCGAKKACGACNPCNPCAVKKACGACNPCAVKKACSPCNPCNPCAVKKGCNPCNPCKTSSACNPCNPCGAGVKGPQVSVSGVLVDTRCYSADQRNVNDEHYMGASKVKGCATACAKMGIPVAMLDGGTLFTVAAPAPALAPYMAKQARMTGIEVSPGVVMPTKVEVKTKSGWKRIQAKGMM